MAKFANIDAYIAALPEGVRAVAVAVCGAIRSAVPQATATIRYDMPAFQIAGASFLYFAVWKKHVGLYPIYRGSADFEAEVGPYRARTDTVQFALSAPMPFDLIGKIAAAQRDRLVVVSAGTGQQGGNPAPKNPA